MKKLLLLTFLILSSLVNAQTKWGTKSKKAIKYVEKGIEVGREYDPVTLVYNYSGAIEWFDKAIEKDPNFIDAYIIKGDYAIKAGMYDEGIAAYKKAIEINPEYSKTGFIYFDLALLEWTNGYYDDALVHAKKFKTYKTANPESLVEADWIIVNCEFAIKAKANPLPFKPENVGAGVNTFDPEYFPTLTVDQSQLLFTRRVTETNGRWQEDFFVSDDFEGYWGKAVPMPNNINTPFNEGAPTFAPDGRTLVFVGCAVDRVGYGPGRRGYGSCDLFITQKVGEQWLDPINLPGNVNTANWETQPSLSSDGRTLYFIRGTKNSSGGRNMRNGDIYVAKLQEDGSWGKAEKLPDNINTEYSESSCLIHPDGKTLYFSSNGHVGMGGYDLYKTELQPDGSWSDPVNLGYPINTHNNENSLLVFANGEIAIFGSDRDGGMGSLDLYQFIMPEEIRPTKTIYMTGTVFDARTNQKLEAEFILKDLETGAEVVYSKSDKITGGFLVTLPVNKDYALIVNKPGYHPYSVNFTLTVPENSDEPYHRDVPLTNSVGQPITLENVFFDLDSYVLRKESFIELDNLVSYLKTNPKIKIELQGHTDAQGNDEDNLKLSQNRANAVKEYLVSKGIDADRLTAKGYGETQPAYTKNAKGENIQLTEDYINSLATDKEKKAAHQLNRRTVYVVTEL